MQGGTGKELLTDHDMAKKFTGAVRERTANANWKSSEQRAKEGDWWTCPTERRADSKGLTVQRTERLSEKNGGPKESEEQKGWEGRARRVEGSFEIYYTFLWYWGSLKVNMGFEMQP